jgi:prepilin-type N-terminal cleavage/methylation domain-containing protein
VRLGTRGLAPAHGDDDAGFTIIELVVALSVIAVGIFATMQVFLGSLATTAYSDSRTRATALAAREVEGMRAAPYAQVGVSTSAPGYVSSITEGGQTYQTVVVSSPLITPQGTPEVVGGVTYAIRRDAVWMPLGSATNAFKRVIATVTWTDRAGTHSVRQDAGVYPGGLGVYGGAGATTTTTAAPSVPSNPTGFTATLNSTSPTTAVDLSWSVGAVAPVYWELHYSSNAGASWVPVTASQPAGTTNYALSGLSSGTAYLFRVRGVNGVLSSQWVQATATTQAAAPTCTILSAAVSPTSVQKKSNNALADDLNVYVNTSGVCQGLKAELPTSTPFQVSMLQYGTTFYYIHSKNDTRTWSTGAKTIRILSSTNVQLATISLVVTN